MALSLYTLAQLVASSALIKSSSYQNVRLSHSLSDALQKEMGTVYYNNKVVFYDPDTSIIEIRMMIGTKTETQYTGFHAVRLAIYGAKGQLYNSLEDLYWDKIGDKNIGSGVDPQGDLQRMRKATKGKATNSKGELPEIDNELFDIDYGAEINSKLTGALLPVAHTGANTFGKSFGATGRVFYLEEPIGIHNYVRVFCSCSDYQYTCGWYNYEAGAHLGPRPAPYPNRSGGSETVRNVNKTPGLCKHLMVMVTLLMNGGIINTLGAKNFGANREILMNRAEKLSIPRKLADSNKLNKMFSTLDQNIKQARAKRNFQAGFKATYIHGYDEWSRSKIIDNSRKLRSGERTEGIKKGTGFAAYQNDYTKQAGKEIQQHLNRYGVNNQAAQDRLREIRQGLFKKNGGPGTKRGEL